MKADVVVTVTFELDEPVLVPSYHKNPLWATKVHVRLGGKSVTVYGHQLKQDGTPANRKLDAYLYLGAFNGQADHLIEKWHDKARTIARKEGVLERVKKLLGEK